MAVEFGAAIKLDSRSALDQMKKFADQSRKASTVLRELQEEVKSTNQGLGSNTFKKYVDSSRKMTLSTKKNIAAIHDQTKTYSKLSDEQKKLISSIDRLNQKYSESARNEARLTQIKKELQMITGAGLQTKKQELQILKQEALKIKESTTAYKMQHAEKLKSNALSEREKKNLHELKMKYDSVYAANIKIAKVTKELNILRKKSYITDKQYNTILARQSKHIREVTAHTVRLTSAQSMLAKTARLVSIYSRVFLGLYAAARLSRFYTDLTITSEKIQLLSDKLEFLTGDSGAYKKLFDMTQDVGINMEAANKIITRFAVVTDRAFSIDTMNEWSATLIRSARATGTSTQEMSGALIQITQAMSAGRLMGDEYRSVTENLPLLTVALRDLFGKSTMSLKELSSQGLITNKVMVEAFGRLKVLLEGFPDSTQTVEAAFGRLSSAWDNFIATMVSSDLTKNVLNTVTDMLNASNEAFLEADRIRQESYKNTLTARVITLKRVIAEEEKILKEREGGGNKGLGVTDIISNLFNNSKTKESTENIKKYNKALDRTIKIIKSLSISDGDIAKIKADADIQAIRDQNKAYAQQLKTLELIDKINKGKSVQTVRKEADLQRNLIDEKIERFIAGEAGGISKESGASLKLTVAKNEEDAIQKIIKTRIDGQLRLQGLKTKFDIEDIEKELSHNSKVLEIEKKFANNVIQIESAREARRLGLKEGQNAKLLSTVTPEKANELLSGLDSKRAKDIQEYISKISSEINSMIISAEKASMIIQKDGLGLLAIQKDGVLNDFDKSIIALEKRYKSLEGTSGSLTRGYVEEYNILKRLKDLRLKDADTKFDEGLEDKFSAQAVATRKQADSTKDLTIARERLVITEREYLRQQKLIYEAYSNEITQAKALTHELSGLDQIYKGLEMGARGFMENTETTFEWFRNSTEELLDGSIDLILDQSKSGQEAFKALVNSMIKDLARLAIKRAVVNSFDGLFTGTSFGSSATTNIGAESLGTGSTSAFDTFAMSSKGNVFSGKGISSYSGTIVSKPTIFPFAKGTGIMGEGGKPEAILPLTRRGGKLGVEGGSGGDVSIVVNNMSSSKVEPKVSQDTDGKKIVTVMVHDAVSEMVHSGKFDTMMTPYNITRTGRR